MAQEFGALLRYVLCETVTASHLQLVALPNEGDWTRSQWLATASGPASSSVPLRLIDGTYLLVQQRLGIRQKGGDWWLTTLDYRYCWQADEDDSSAIVAWDYERERPAPPLAHLHLNCSPANYPSGRTDFSKLHLPAGRLPLEDVLRFLVVEQGIGPRSDTWEATLAEAGEIFARIQAERAAADQND